MIHGRDNRPVVPANYSSFFFLNPTMAATNTEKLMTNATTTVLFCLTNSPAASDETFSVTAVVTASAGVGVVRSCFTRSKVAKGVGECTGWVAPFFTNRVQPGTTVSEVRLFKRLICSIVVP